MNWNLPVYGTRVTAFIDILGFKEHVQNFPRDQKLFKRLHYALLRIKTIERLKLSPTKNRVSDLEVNIFSDSIVISAQEQNLDDLITAIGYLQADLLYVGMLARGGVAKGGLIHIDGIVYGESLIRAYELESKAAVYPRIIIDNALYAEYAKTFIPWVKNDVDGLVFIDPFKFDAFAGDAEELAADGYDPRNAYFQEVRARILEGIQDSSQVDHKMKWNWIAYQFNLAISAVQPDDWEIVHPIAL